MITVLMVAVALIVGALAVGCGSVAGANEGTAKEIIGMRLGLVMMVVTIICAFVAGVHL